jgi:hypothetical protein
VRKVQEVLVEETVLAAAEATVEEATAEGYHSCWQQ